MPPRAGRGKQARVRGSGIDAGRALRYFPAPRWHGVEWRRRFRGVAQPGRAPGSGPGGRRFESCLPDSWKAASSRSNPAMARPSLLVTLAFWDTGGTWRSYFCCGNAKSRPLRARRVAASVVVGTRGSLVGRAYTLRAKNLQTAASIRRRGEEAAYRRLAAKHHPSRTRRRRRAGCWGPGTNCGPGRYFTKLPAIALATTTPPGTRGIFRPGVGAISWSSSPTQASSSTS